MLGGSPVGQTGDSMSERFFRLLLGVTLLIILFFEWHDLLYVYIGIITFEGLTNWRIPNLILKLRHGPAYLEIHRERSTNTQVHF